MSVDTISRHEVAVFQAVGKDWITSRDIAERADVAPITARQHLVRFVRAGLIERANVFPGYRYRSAQNGNAHEHPYLKRLNDAASVFGLKAN